MLKLKASKTYIVCEIQMPSPKLFSKIPMELECNYTYTIAKTS
jgi:hypothetical protein